MMCPLWAYMTYVRAKTRKGKTGNLTYYYLVEGKRINGKMKQKVIKYLGKNPDAVVVELDKMQTKAVIEEVFLAELTPEELKIRLKQLRIPAPEGTIVEMNLTHKIGGKKCIFRLCGQFPTTV